MNSDLTLVLTGALLFLILSSRFAYSFVKKTTGLTDDMSTIARTVLFGLLMMASIRFL